LSNERTAIKILTYLRLNYFLKKKQTNKRKIEIAAY